MVFSCVFPVPSWVLRLFSLLGFGGVKRNSGRPFSRGLENRAGASFVEQRCLREKRSARERRLSNNVIWREKRPARFCKRRLNARGGIISFLWCAPLNA